MKLVLEWRERAAEGVGRGAWRQTNQVFPGTCPEQTQGLGKMPRSRKQGRLKMMLVDPAGQVWADPWNHWRGLGGTEE